MPDYPPPITEHVGNLRANCQETGISTVPIDRNQVRDYFTYTLDDNSPIHRLVYPSISDIFPEFSCFAKFETALLPYLPTRMPLYLGHCKMCAYDVVTKEVVKVSCLTNLSMVIS